MAMPMTLNEQVCWLEKPKCQGCCHRTLALLQSTSQLHISVTSQRAKEVLLRVKNAACRTLRAYQALCFLLSNGRHEMQQFDLYFEGMSQYSPATTLFKSHYCKFTGVAEP